MRKIYRQGDVLLIEVDNETLFEGKKQERDNQGRLVLEYGEVTGHAHAFYHQGVNLTLIQGGLRILETEEESILKHEEHADIILPAKKKFKIVRQVQYTPERIIQVAD